MHSYHQMAQDVKHWAFKAGGCYDNQLQLPASWLKLDCFWGRRRTRGQRKKGKKRRGWGRVGARGEESNLWRPAVNVRKARQSELGSACAHQDHGAHHLIPLSPLGCLALLNGVVWLFDMKATFFPAARGELALRGHHLALFVSPPVLGVIPPPRYFTRANFLLKDSIVSECPPLSKDVSCLWGRLLKMFLQNDRMIAISFQTSSFLGGIFWSFSEMIVRLLLFLFFR